MPRKGKTDEEIITMGEYYATHDDNYEQAAAHFPTTKRTFTVYMSKLAEISGQTYALVKQKQDQNRDLGAKKGGLNGKPTGRNGGRKLSISDEDLTAYGLRIKHQGTPIRALADELGIPKSTLHDNLKKRPNPSNEPESKTDNQGSKKR